MLLPLRACLPACLRLQLFIAGESDRFIAPTHSKLIFERYSGDKNLVRAEGGAGTQGRRQVPLT
jgi:hypothetical protein